MNRSSSDNGEPPALGDGGLPDSSESPRSEGVAGTGSHTHDAVAHRATPVASAHEFDPRLRGLRGEPTDDVPAPSGRTDHGQQRRLAPLLAKVAAFVAVAALAVLLLRSFVVQPFTVPGDAMAPTLQEGDHLVVLKSGLLEGPIRTGDIVVFRPRRSLPCAVAGSRVGDLVLRVVALPGEVIKSVGNSIFVDGRPLRERGWYDRASGEISSTPIRTTTMAPGQYFVMADNRADACDSRVFGPIAQSSIVGEGIAVVGRHGHVFLGTL